MSEQWMGLHNPERHSDPTTSVYGITYCDCQGSSVCEPDGPCYCCLAAEVEALRAQANRPSLDDLQVEDYRRVRAQVQAVRQVADNPRHSTEWEGDVVLVANVRRALEGDSDE